MKKLTYFVPVDFTDCSYNTLQYATMLARFSEGQVKLCHVIDLENVPESDNQVVILWSLDRLVKTAKEKMKSLREIASLDGITVDENIVFGNVKLELVKQIKRTEPNVVVIGRNSDRKPMHNSIADYISRNVRYPVLVVPGSHNPKLPNRAVLASDMRPGRVKEFEPFFDILKRNSQELSILNINGKYPSDESDQKVWIEKLNAAYQIDAALLPRQEDEGIKTVTDIIQSNQVDLLCLIKRNKGFLDKFFRRTETNQLADYTEVPVLVLHEY